MLAFFKGVSLASTFQTQSCSQMFSDQLPWRKHMDPPKQIMLSCHRSNFQTLESILTTKTWPFLNLASCWAGAVQGTGKWYVPRAKPRLRGASDQLRDRRPEYMGSDNMCIEHGVEISRGWGGGCLCRWFIQIVYIVNIGPSVRSVRMRRRGWSSEKRHQGREPQCKTPEVGACWVGGHVWHSSWATPEAPPCPSGSSGSGLPLPISWSSDVPFPGEAEHLRIQVKTLKLGRSSELRRAPSLLHSPMFQPEVWGVSPQHSYLH